MSLVALTGATIGAGLLGMNSIESQFTDPTLIDKAVVKYVPNPLEKISAGVREIISSPSLNDAYYVGGMATLALMTYALYPKNQS